MTIWIISYLILSILDAWIIFWGGAEFLENTWLFDYWNAEQIKFYVIIIWFAETIYFLWGVFDSSVRAFYGL